MLKNELTVLMIDDHPIIIEGYKRVLISNKKNKLNISTANNCDQAVSAIHKAGKTKPFDIVFIDIQLPPSKDGTVTSGEDLAILVKQELPKTKIVILTMFDNPSRLQNILNMVPHDALLIKSDITSKILLTAFDSILKGKVFYSKTVQSLRTKFLENKDTLDETNKKIIYFLSKGVKTKNLVEHINLSLSTIEKRKNRIKQFFNVSDDEQLLNEAKKRGFT